MPAPAGISDHSGGGPVYRCTPRLLLRQQPDAIELLSKADWSGVGRAVVDRRGQLNHLVIVPGARRQGLATELWQGLADRQRPTAIDLPGRSLDSGAAAWLESLGWQTAHAGYRPANDADPLPQLDFEGYQRTRAAAWAEELGVAPDYVESRGLTLITEPPELELAGADCFSRPLYLAPEAAAAWRRLLAAARADGITLQAVSGFRSIDYQGRLLRRKLEAGTPAAEMLRVSAAPGFSEHHGGFALDLTTPNYPPLETQFSDSEAFAWLSANAAAWGFVMSYPADNPHQLAYEPWHWRFDAALPRTA